MENYQLWLEKETVLAKNSLEMKMWPPRILDLNLNLVLLYSRGELKKDIRGSLMGERPYIASQCAFYKSTPELL